MPENNSNLSVVLARCASAADALFGKTSPFETLRQCASPRWEVDLDLEGRQPLVFEVETDDSQAGPFWLDLDVGEPRTAILDLEVDGQPPLVLDLDVS